MTDLWFPAPADLLRDPRITTLSAEEFGALVRLYGTARSIGSDAVAVPGMSATELLERLGGVHGARVEHVLDRLEERGLVAIEGNALRACIGWPLPHAATPAAPLDGATESPAPRTTPRPLRVQAALSQRAARKAVAAKLRDLDMQEVPARVAWVEGPGASWCESKGIDPSVALSVARRDATGQFGTVTTMVTSGDDHGGYSSPQTVTTTVATRHRDGDDHGDESSPLASPSEREETQQKEGIENTTDTARTVTTTVTSSRRTPVTTPSSLVTAHGDDHGDESFEVVTESRDRSEAPASLSSVPPGPKPTKKITDVERVFAHWRTAMDHPRSVLDAKRHTLIQRALKTWSADELCRAIDGYASSAWHRGENDRGRAFDGLDLILRDAAHVEKGWELDDEAKAARTSAEKTSEGDPWIDGWKKTKRAEAALRGAVAGEVIHG